MEKILVVLRRLGPYHHARFKVASKFISVLVLETRPYTNEYPWDMNQNIDDGIYSLIKLKGAKYKDSEPSVNLIYSQINEIIEFHKPTTVLSVGWADKSYQVLLSICQKKQIPIIIASDSREIDQKRNIFKEYIKKQLLKGYSSALVAGQESRNYIEKLGFPKKLIHLPWDVVDNDFFEKNSNLNPCSSKPHFLSVGRFIKKKNIEGLLKAYNKYQIEGGKWGLKLIGTGPEEKKIRSISNSLHNNSKFKIIPFQQIDQLAYSYSQASAYILASTSDQWGLVINEAIASGLPCLVSSSCGCAIDLIDHGKTGWSFNPLNTDELASLLFKVENQTQTQKNQMIIAAKEKLDNFNLDSFAINLRECIEKATLINRKSIAAQITAKFLSLRP